MCANSKFSFTSIQWKTFWLQLSRSILIPSFTLPFFSWNKAFFSNVFTFFHIITFKHLLQQFSYCDGTNHFKIKEFGVACKQEKCWRFMWEIVRCFPGWIFSLELLFFFLSELRIVAFSTASALVTWDDRLRPRALWRILILFWDMHWGTSEITRLQQQIAAESICSYTDCSHQTVKL